MNYIWSRIRSLTILLCGILAAFVILLATWGLCDRTHIRRASGIGHDLDIVSHEGPPTVILEVIARYQGRQTAPTVFLDNRLVPEVGICGGAEEKFELHAGPSSFTNKIRKTFSTILPGRFQPWTYDALIYLLHGRVSCVIQEIRVFRRDGKIIEGRIQTTGHGLEEVQHNSMQPLNEVSAGAVRGYIYELTLTRTGAAAPGSSDLESNFDFGCFERMQGCMHPCELLPRAWHLYRQNTGEHGPNPPAWMADDSCRGSTNMVGVPNR